MGMETEIHRKAYPEDRFLMAVKKSQLLGKASHQTVCMLGWVQLFATSWTIYSPPGSSVHGIILGRILEWVVISCSRGSY